MKEAFEYLGYTPPVALIGEMSGPDDEENERNRHNFVKLMGDTRSLAHDLGWKYEAGSIEGHYFSRNPKANSSDVLITACQTQRYLFRVTPNEGELSNVATRLACACRQIADALAIPTDLDINAVVRVGGKTKAIDITTTLRNILGTNTKTVSEIERRLSEFHTPLLMALQG